MTLNFFSLIYDCLGIGICFTLFKKFYFGEMVKIEGCVFVLCNKVVGVFECG